MNSGINGDVRIRSLSKRFGPIYALRDVSLDISAGEVVGLIGPNGAGKTTLFECIAGVMPADAGTVETADASGPSPLFYVPDGITPWETQEVTRALHLFGALHFRTDVECDGILAELGIDAFAGQVIGGLSRGQRKRTLIAFGLIASRAVLLLDEPFEGLDLRQTQEVSRVLRSHAARGRTLFLSIHQLHDAERVCDRMILLSAGRVVGAGTLAELRVQAGSPDASLEDIFLALT